MFAQTIQKDKTIALKMKNFVEHLSVFIDVKIVFKYIKYSHKKQKRVMYNQINIPHTLCEI